MPSRPEGRILLVEDDEVFGSLVRRHLEARGHAVDLARTAGDAAALLRAGRRPWLVLLDINLPGESGWSLLRDAAYEAAGSAPVVVVSATHVSPQKLRDYAVAGYLPKPFAMQTLMELVERRAALEGGGSIEERAAAPADA